MNYVFGYGRSSTSVQEITTSAQKTTCESWFQLQKDVGRFGDDFEWGGWFEDTSVSSDIPWLERPAGDRLLSTVQSKDIIVVATYDRCFRSVVDCSRSMRVLTDGNVRIVILDTPELDTTTANGMLVVNILAAVKEHEKRIIKERTRDARIEMLRQRKPINGSPPRGWKVSILNGEKRLVPDAYIRKVADYIAELREDHKLPYERIYWKLLLEGVRRKDGSEFSSTVSVYNLYKSREKGYPLSPDPHVQRSLSLLEQQGRVLDSSSPSPQSSGSSTPAE